MKRRVSRGLIFLFPLIGTFLVACHDRDYKDRFPLAEQYHMDAEELCHAFDAMAQVEGALSLIVCRKGTIVAEEFYYYNDYGPDSIKNIMSVTKTFTGVLVGLAIEQGYIGSVNDSISRYLDDVLTFPGEGHANITIDHLLKMTAGHAWNGTSPDGLFEEWMEAKDPLQFIIDLPLVNSPGSTFNYSDGASHLLSVIITEATGQNTADYASENLLNPLGITDYSWPVDKRGYTVGAAWLRIRPHDMVKFGNFILDEGRYNQVQVVPEHWIQAMTTQKISTGNDLLYGPGYGYQVWLGSQDGHDYFMAMGWGGQFIIGVPDYDLVVTATCWTSGVTMQQAGEHWTSIIRIIMERILPAVR